MNAGRRCRKRGEPEGKGIDRPEHEAFNELYRRLAAAGYVQPESEIAQALIGEWHDLLQTMAVYADQVQG